MENFRTKQKQEIKRKQKQEIRTKIQNQKYKIQKIKRGKKKQGKN